MTQIDPDYGGHLPEMLPETLARLKARHEENLLDAEKRFRKEVALISKSIDRINQRRKRLGE